MLFSFCCFEGPEAGDRDPAHTGAERTLPWVREGGGECTPKQVILGECRWRCTRVRLGRVRCALLAEALRAAPARSREVSPSYSNRQEHANMAAWCECRPARPVVRAAAEAAERCARGEAVDVEEGLRAVRMALTGLLPACRAAGELDERGQKKLEAAVARAVISAQAVVTAMLHEYKESTRKARAAKWAELDAWWGEERRRRAIRARVARGLTGPGEDAGAGA